MIPKNEITALIALIERLEETPPLTPLLVFRKEKERRYTFSPDGNNPDVQAHQKKYGKKSAHQPRDKNHPIYGDTFYALGFQVRYLDAELNDWFAWAHFVPPGIASRINAILKRAKMLELKDRFNTAYDPHFSWYWKQPIPLEPTGDHILDNLIEGVRRLHVTLKSIDEDGEGGYTYSFEFCCRDCGGYIVSSPDDSDDGPALCLACGQVFGEMGQVKELAHYIGALEMQKRGLVE